MHPTVLHRAAIAAGLLGLFVPLSSFAQDPLPRYKLEVGQEIQYQGSSEYHFDAGGGVHFDRSWTFWVIGRNGDGSWRVVERHVVTYHDLGAPGRTQTERTTRGPIGRFDLFADGRIVGDASDAYSVFSSLPKQASDKTWRIADSSLVYSVLPDGPPGEFVIQCRNTNPIYPSKGADTIRFDLRRGLVICGSGESEQSYPRHSKGTGASHLESVRTRDAEFIAQLARESDVYFRAKAAYDRAMKDAWSDPAKTSAIAQEAKRQLHDARTRITLPPLTEPLDQILAEHDRTAKLIQETVEDTARHVAAVINKPAAGWELKDLTGKTHRLSDYRGKVVVLDFWYRACGYCIDAMPQLKQVADDFRNDPVAVLGMNVDDDPKDAAFIADRQALNYPTLLAKGTDVVPRLYGVMGYPTLIVIDATGIVRDIQSGYSPHTREELGRTVRKLLPTKGG